MQLVWPDSFVEESGLTRNIWSSELAGSNSGEEFIETIPKIGYRFTADVAEHRIAPTTTMSVPGNRYPQLSGIAGSSGRYS